MMVERGSPPDPAPAGLARRRPRPRRGHRADGPERRHGLHRRGRDRDRPPLCRAARARSATTSPTSPRPSSSFRAEELEHRDTALAAGAEDAFGYPDIVLPHPRRLPGRHRAFEKDLKQMKALLLASSPPCLCSPPRPPPPRAPAGPAAEPKINQLIVYGDDRLPAEHRRRRSSSARASPRASASGSPRIFAAIPTIRATRPGPTAPSSSNMSAAPASAAARRSARAAPPAASTRSSARPAPTRADPRFGQLERADRGSAARAARQDRRAGRSRGSRTPRPTKRRRPAVSRFSPPSRREQSARSSALLSPSTERRPVMKAALFALPPSPRAARSLPRARGRRNPASGKGQPRHRLRQRPLPARRAATRSSSAPAGPRPSATGSRRSCATPPGRSRKHQLGGPRRSLEYVGRTGIQSCSTVGPGGVSGCWNEMVRAWRRGSPARRRRAGTVGARPRYAPVIPAEAGTRRDAPMLV